MEKQGNGMAMEISQQGLKILRLSSLFQSGNGSHLPLSRNQCFIVCGAEEVLGAACVTQTRPLASNAFFKKGTKASFLPDLFKAHLNATASKHLPLGYLCDPRQVSKPPA